MALSSNYKRFKREVSKISPHIRFKHIRLGFVRLYYKSSYLSEVDTNMPYMGYDFVMYNPRLENRSFYEEYEDNIDVIKNVKNFKDGYVQAIDRVKTRMWLHRHSKEFNKEAEQFYQKVSIK